MPSTRVQIFASFPSGDGRAELEGDLAIHVPCAGTGGGDPNGNGIGTGALSRCGSGAIRKQGLMEEADDGGFEKGLLERKLRLNSVEGRCGCLVFG